jgi:carboxymethylenebutenolidase
MNLNADSELITGRLDEARPDGQRLMGYLARPRDAGPRPAVVVIQEWWGVNAHIEDVTERLARQGYVALAPDLYHGVTVSEPDEARKMVMQLHMDDAVCEIQRAIDYMMEQEYVAGPKVGIIGFCMGGRLVLETARAEDKLGAAVVFYGRPLAPDEAGQVRAPVLGLYGAEDHGIPPESIRAMDQALEKAGIPHEIHIYESAGHAFFNDTRPAHNQHAADDAWLRALTWFGKYLNPA